MLKPEGTLSTHGDSILELAKLQKKTAPMAISMEGEFWLSKALLAASLSTEMRKKQSANSCRNSATAKIVVTSSKKLMGEERLALMISSARTFTRRTTNPNRPLTLITTASHPLPCDHDASVYTMTLSSSGSSNLDFFRVSWSSRTRMLRRHRSNLGEKPFWLHFGRLMNCVSGFNTGLNCRSTRALKQNISLPLSTSASLMERLRDWSALLINPRSASFRPREMKKLGASQARSKIRPRTSRGVPTLTLSGWMAKPSVENRCRTAATALDAKWAGTGAG
mmetsp:Transcript_25312/g.63713  ORF Transcript_25312/g.63713 Transcript_25312/m.63713 type:complete len:280 (-) Transcript_25312:1359-2198(-)